MKRLTPSAAAVMAFRFHAGIAALIVAFIAVAGLHVCEVEGGVVLVPYDDFDSGGKDGSRWGYDDDGHHPVDESNGQMWLWAKYGGQTQMNTASTQDLGEGMNICGAKWTMSWSGGASDNMTSYGRITNGTPGVSADYIEVFYNSWGPSYNVNLGGSYGSGNIGSCNSNSPVTVDIKQVDSNGSNPGMHISINNQSISSFAGGLAPNSYLKFRNQAQNTAVTGGDKKLIIDDVSLYVAVPDTIKSSDVLNPTIISGGTTAVGVTFV